MLSQVAATHVNGKQPDQVGMIPISKIRHNPVALRPVDKESEDYLSMADSVKKHGIFNPILLREFENPESRGEVLYSIIDGLQRFNCALDAGLTEIPAKITDMDQAEIEETQIIANAQKIETKPFQYAEAIERLLQRNPTMSAYQLSEKLSKPIGWLYKMLNMNKRLHDDIKPLVDDKKMTITNAYELSKLPSEEQVTWIDKACTMDPGEFSANIAARSKEIKEARKKGRAESPPVFEPVPNSRKWAEIRAEYAGGASTLVAAIRRQKITDPVEAVKFAVAWVCRMDPDSQAEQRQADEALKSKRQADKVKRDLEKTNAKLEEGARTRAELEAKLKEKAAVA